MKKVLVTGGIGFIGSHTVVELIKQDYKVIIIDNLSNSSIKILNRIKKIVGKEKLGQIFFYKLDLIKGNSLTKVSNDFKKIDICIHFAGLKAVGESVKDPLLYYNTNILSTTNLLKFMETVNCKKIIFSSSATVYGNTKSPLSEDSIAGIGITNPYGRTKYMIEEILKDYVISNKNFSVICLRYFNPIGAHESGLIGENPKGIPNNLMPYIQQVISGKKQYLTIFGNDYNTKDGTGVRDYIHVTDLAKGHSCALKKIENEKNIFSVYNLGTGKGYSVLEVIKEVENVSGKKIPYKIDGRRQGDLDIVYCNPKKANIELGWKANKNLKDMCKDSVNWESKINSKNTIK
jgi:UDP-glucose 4-epimerase